MILELPEPAVGAAAEPPFVARVRLRALRRARFLRHQWAQADDGDRYLAIPHSEVERILAGADEARRAEAEFCAADAHCALAADALAAVEEAAAADERWRVLERELGLTPAERDLLELVVAAALDPSLARLYGYLLDETGAAQPSPWLAAALYGHERVRPPRALARWALASVEPGADADAPTARWTADAEIAAWLAGDEAWRAEGVELIRPPGLVLYPHELERLVAFVRRLGAGAAWELELVGEPGSGRRTLAAQLAAWLGRELLAVDAAAADAVRAARRARLTGALVHWHGLERAPEGAEAALRRLLPAAVFGVVAALPAGTAARATVALPRATTAQRRALWAAQASSPVPALVETRPLTPGDVAAIAAAAPAGDAAAAAAARRRLQLGPSELFTPLPCPYTWDDLVLAEPALRHLREFEAQARLRREVYEDWGLERLVPLGAGVTALFAGPSGTGKTMAAQVLARSLELDLMRVDLAGVVNKYIGETEKRLRRVFDACERANVLLLFDEADALFGRRTQVRDAHDRFANIEIDYLLQRMEQFDGVAVLATNRKSDLDPAFVRRLRFIVDFIPPGEPERRALWLAALPERAANGEPLRGDVDVAALAARLELTGASIKLTALAAAFLAREEGSRIELRHVVHAARRELAKQGRELGPGWGSA